jgi:hypothetical protein
MFQFPHLFFENARRMNSAMTEKHFNSRNIDFKIDNPTILKHNKVLADMRCFSELDWRDERRPYYKVYPKILSALCRVNLNLPLSSLEYPVRTLMVLLPKGQTEIMMYEIEKPLCALLVTLADRPRNQGKVFSVMGYIGDNQTLDCFSAGITVYFDDEISIEDSLSRHPKGVTKEMIESRMRYITKWLRLCVALSLLARDTDLIIPDILKDDEGKELTDVIVRRAHNRGKRGWLIGSKIEVCPHVRIPHLFHACVGPGESQGN